MPGRLAMMAGGLALMAACATDGQWFTPAGVALGEIDCISPAPLAGPSGREICKGHLIPETAEEIARCGAQGGTAGPVSVVDARFACVYGTAGVSG